MQANKEDWQRYVADAQTQSDSVIHHVGACARPHGLERSLELLDRAIAAAARSVQGNPAPSVIFGLRTVLLKHAAESFTGGATKAPTALISTIRHLSSEMSRESAVAIFLDRVAVHLGYRDEFGTYLVSWDDVVSWMRTSPPKEVEDLFGETGNTVKMQIPEVLRQAIELDRTFKDTKTYYS